MSVETVYQGSVAVLTLGFSAQHNALSKALVSGLMSALRNVDVTRARAIVLAGGAKFFSAGANITDLLQSGWLSGGPDDEDPVSLFRALAELPLPVVAAVERPALGGGFELCLSCDLVVASEAAWFAAPEVGLGVVPNTALARLSAIVGRRRAFEIMATRRRISAAEALSLGIVNQVVPEDACGAAIQLAARIVEGAPPGALRVLKQTLDCHQPTDWALVRQSVGWLSEPEWQEGLAAFLAKRSPNYEPFWEARR